MKELLQRADEITELDSKRGHQGEWFYQLNADVYTHIVRPVNKPGMIVVSLSQRTDGVSENDAKFIAAAPKMAQLIQDLTATLREREWRPIETADKEKNIKILACESKKKTRAGHSFEPSIYIAQVVDTAWNGKVFAKMNGDLCFPTHFMPLPSIPEVAE